ncbi:hypothetical protein ABZ626_28820 [Streptomyces longispororuber]|uniref:hypothetical protein n=1 Tax=Streptomyces TaxID=1883 RepID=UPI0024A8D13B|nr:hypothetical protein [Streptomyces sp. CC224B]
MSQEAVPEQAHDPLTPEESLPRQERVQPPAGPRGASKGLLQQMEELMAALNADLSRLDADLQRPPTDEPGPHPH